MVIADEPPGTRFLLFPQAPFLDDFQEPELVEVSSPPGTVGPGPSNARMYTVHPVGKPTHYGAVEPGPGGPGLYLPPWRGRILDPALPDEAGNFDHIDPSDPSFEAAHLFGSAHFAMDVWEGYFGRPIPWHFARDYARLELSILPSLDNALIGWGFLETGGTTEYGGEYRPYSLNFDVVAHEIGHAVIYSEVGIPSPENASGEYYGFHESAADLVALLTSLHFGSVVDDVLESTHGNLYTLNKLSRFAELSTNRQIRLAANDRVLSEFARGWTDEHELAQPLTGAMFDILVDVFHERLLARGLISQEMEDLSDQLEGDPDYGEIMQTLFDARYALDPEGFRLALLEARDYLGSYLADAWAMLDPNMLSYYGVGQALEEVDLAITGGQFLRIIRGNFQMREIGLIVPGPRLEPPGADSHSASVRTLVPD
jgi:hypothetical protein